MRRLPPPTAAAVDCDVGAFIEDAPPPKRRFLLGVDEAEADPPPPKVPPPPPDDEADAEGDVETAARFISTSFRLRFGDAEEEVDAAEPPPLPLATFLFFWSQSFA